MNEVKFYDAFCGIGGFHLGITQAHPDWECAGACDIDKHARKIYGKHFPGVRIDDDIRKLDGLPEGTDMFCGGFPCQSFSIAGKRGGFEDTRGTLFFEIARLLKVSRPKWVFLENVKGLLSHDNGRTFGTILYTLGELGYWWEYQVLNSKDFGVPQNRERVFIVGHLAGERSSPLFPLGEGGGLPDTEQGGTPFAFHALTSSDYKGVSRQRPNCIQQINNPAHAGNRVYSQDGVSPSLTARAREDQCASPKIAIPVLTPGRMEKRQDGRRFKEDGEPAFTLSAQDKHGIYDGATIRRLTEVECERLQGFPDGWTEGISASQRYKCLGNAVTVNVIRAIAERMG